MSTLTTANRVVVGTDGSLAAHSAVDWAAHEASERGLPLLIISSVPEHPLPRRSSLFASLGRDRDYLENVRDKARIKLSSEERRVKLTYPDLVVEKSLVEGVASYPLARATKDAALVVVGARGHSAPLRVKALGGTSDAVVTHAHGLVAVIPEEASQSTGPVVVGVDDAPAAHEAIRVAFAEAARRGVSLVPIFVWHEPALAAETAVMGSIALSEVSGEIELFVDELLAPLVADYPQVAVERRVEVGYPASVLVDASRDASLVVVGSRGRGGFAGLMLGSTSRAVLRDAHCPVIVVRERPAAAQK